jgi:hypothetical protein
VSAQCESLVRNLGLYHLEGDWLIDRVKGCSERWLSEQAIRQTSNRATQPLTLIVVTHELTLGKSDDHTELTRMGISHLVNSVAHHTIPKIVPPGAE